MTGYGRPYCRGMFGINLAVLSLGLMVFHGLVPGLSAEDWDSETFVKQLDELRGRDEDRLRNRKAEDPEWADYLSSIEPEYDENGFPEISTTDPLDNIFAQKLNWSLTGRGEVPYLAVIYQFIEGETEEDGGAMSGVVAHRACGGVLVSEDRLITNCLCVASYFASHLFPRNEIAIEGQTSILGFDLGWKTRGKYLINGKLNRIYVQFGSNRFLTGKNMPGVKDPINDRHLVDGPERPEPDLPLVTKEQECGDLVQVAWHSGTIPNRYDPRQVYQFAETLALVPYWPAIYHPAPGQFVPWPPFEFNDRATFLKLIQNPRLPLEQVVVTGMGFEKSSEHPPDCHWKLLDDEGQEIPLNKQAINLPYIHCTRRDDFTCRGKKLEDKLFKLSCFCDLYEQEVIGAHKCKTIADGTHGWPIIFQGNVVALTASRRDVNLPGNPVLGSSLAFGKFRDHVERILTKEKILKQRTERPPMFREDVAGENYVFYDYPEQPRWFVHEGTTPKLIPLSLAVHFGPHPVASVVTPLISVFMYLTSPNLV